MMPKYMLPQAIEAAYCTLTGSWIILSPRSFCSFCSVITAGFLSDPELKPDQLDAEFGATTGLFFTYIGVVYWMMFRNREFAKATVLTRLFGINFLFCLIVALGKVSPRLYIFAIPDILLALWTRSTLQADEKAN